MKHYQINSTELKYLQEMISYLNAEEGNLMTTQGSKQVQEIFDRIKHRPVLDLIIDTEAINKQLNEETQND